MSYNQVGIIPNRTDGNLGFGKYANIITFLSLPITMVSVFVCAFGDNTVFKSLFCLPLCTLLCQIIALIKIKVQGNVSVLIISGLYYIRNVIAPIILVLDGYQSKFLRIDQSNVNNAILIMVWETFAITLFIKYIEQKQYLKKEKKYIYIGARIYRLSLVVGVLISIYAIIGSPELRNSFYTIFTSNFYETGKDITESGSSVLRNGGKVLIDALRLVIPVTIIVSMRRRSGQKFSVFIVSICLALLQVLFMTDGNMLILLYVIVQLLLIYRIFPKYRGRLRLIMIVLGIGATFIMLTHRFLQEQSAYSKSISVFMQSYLGGVCDVAGIFRYERSNVFTHLLIDYYSNVPFRSTLFGYSGNDLLTVNWYNAVNGTHSQILPNVAESYYFFGFILSPLYSVQLVYISWHFEQKAKTDNHFLYYGLYTLVYVIGSISIVMYDMRIFLMDVLNIFIWMWFFVRLSRGVDLYIIDDLENDSVY